MRYTFNVTTSESKIISTQSNLAEEMQIKDLKLKLIGPIIETIGYDKVKFFQKGSIFGDDQCMGDFNASENILIFPMNPSLRTILITTLQGNDSVVDSAVLPVSVTSVTATMDSSGPEGGSAIPKGEEGWGFECWVSRGQELRPQKYTFQTKAVFLDDHYILRNRSDNQDFKDFGVVDHDQIDIADKRMYEKLSEMVNESRPDEGWDEIDDKSGYINLGLIELGR